MLAETHYEAALAAATLLLHKLAARPLMLRHERLAIATYLVLDAIRSGKADPAVPAGSFPWADREDWS